MSPTILLRRAALAAVMAASLVTLGAIGWAPLAVSSPEASAGSRRLAAVVYLAGRQVCHQLPHRSLTIGGVPMPVCARCSGLYAGAPLGLVAGVLWPRLRRLAGASPRRWLLVAAAPTLGSVGLEWVAGLSSAVSRACTAVPLGAAVAVVLVLALAVHPGAADRSATLP